MKIALLFGTFDPIHKGHLKVAKNIFKAKIVEQVWFIVTPTSPFKKNKKISSKEDRIRMVNMALEKYNKFIASDIEFGLSAPQYTSATLYYLKKQYPKYNFIILMGSDNYINILKWKDSKYILSNFQICVYKRRGDVINLLNNDIELIGEYIPISSSDIRRDMDLAITKNRLNKNVREYIIRKSLYT